MLEPTALDAFIGGLSTAFFGAPVAGGAYLLRQNLALTIQLQALRQELASLREGQSMMHRLGESAFPETSMQGAMESRGDAPAPP